MANYDEARLWTTEKTIDEPLLLFNLMVIVANCLTCEVAQAQMGVSIIQNSGVSAVKGYGSSWRYLIQIFKIVCYTHRGSTIVFMLLKHNI